MYDNPGINPWYCLGLSFFYIGIPICYFTCLGIATLISNSFRIPEQTKDSITIRYPRLLLAAFDTIFNITASYIAIAIGIVILFLFFALPWLKCNQRTFKHSCRGTFILFGALFANVFAGPLT